VSATEQEGPLCVSCGVDWITATTRKEPHRTFVDTLAHRWRDLHEAQGNQVKSWNWEGYAGHTMDSLSFGTRPDGSIVRLSGDLARQRAGQLLALADHVSRIDVQVTIQETPPCTNFAMDGLARALLDRRCKAGLTCTSLIQSSPAGTTAYIGSRASDRFYRIYDKSAESKGVYLPGAWRYEVEYKGHRAGRVGERLKLTKGGPESCREVVEAAFLDYGVNLPCRPLPRGWRDTSPRMETTDERRLAWLEKSIAPVISRMMESMDRRMVLEALGIIVEGQDDGIDSSTGEIPPT